MRTIGSVRMPIRLGSYVSVAEFIVCDNLALPLILGAVYGDRFVEVILPGKRKVRLSDPRFIY